MSSIFEFEDKKSWCAHLHPLDYAAEKLIIKLRAYNEAISFVTAFSKDPVFAGKCGDMQGDINVGHDVISALKKLAQEITDYLDFKYKDVWQQYYLETPTERSHQQDIDTHVRFMERQKELRRERESRRQPIPYKHAAIKK